MKVYMDIQYPDIYVGARNYLWRKGLGCIYPTLTKRHFDSLVIWTL